MSLKLWGILTDKQKQIIMVEEENNNQEVANNILYLLISYFTQNPTNINILPLINFINKDFELSNIILSVLFLKKRSFYKEYQDFHIYLDESIMYFSSHNTDYVKSLVNMKHSTKKIQTPNSDMIRLVEQASLELYAEHMYKTFSESNIDNAGIKKWFDLQSVEEGIHFTWIIQYLTEHNLIKSFFEHLTLFELKKHNFNTVDVEEMLIKSYEWEVSLTEYINETKNNTSNNTLKILMDKFIVEQEEEESNFSELLLIYNNESIEELDIKMGERGGDEC